MKRLLIVTEHLPPAFHFDLFEPRRGTEKFYLYTAKEAASAGFAVDVEMDGGLTNCGGVINTAPRRTDRPFYDKILVCNPRRVDPTIGKSYSTDVIVWHDFHLGTDPAAYAPLFEIAKGFGSPDLTVISEYSRSLHGPGRNVRVVPLGIDRNVYHPQPNTARKKRVVFTSSPDRGLKALAALWRERQIADRTGYELWTSAYAAGNYTDRDVAEVLATSEFWIHPGEGNELFCLAAVEAQACGATPLVVPNGALAETVKYGYCFTPESFLDGVEAVLSGEAFLPGVNADHIKDWETVTRELLRL